MTRDNAKNAIDLINGLNSIAEEFVVIEGSGKRDKGIMKRYARKNRKVRIYNSVALGYQDPLRMYGLGKCTSEWVLHLDVDERLAQGLKKNLKKLISRTNASAFAFKRYEEVHNGRKTRFFTWQVRLLRRGRVTYRGMVHESPIIKGRLERVEDPDMYLEHVVDLKEKKEREYHKMHKFDHRLSYGAYNRSMLNYLSRFSSSGDENARRSLSGRVLGGWLRFYEAITLRKPDEEISGFDYFFYYLVGNLGYAIMMKSPGIALRSVPGAISEVKTINRWKSEPDSKEYFEISKIINRIGIIRYLKLDKEETIRILYAKYKGRKQGIALLFELLKAQYRKDHGVSQ